MIEGKYQTRPAFHGCLAMLSEKDRPSAIFAANDMMALGVMDAARTLGMSIPEDLSLVGFDDMHGAETTLPPLTTVRQHSFLLGKIASQYLLETIDGPEKARIHHEKLPAELVVRSSTGACPASREATS